MKHTPMVAFFVAVCCAVLTGCSGGPGVPAKTMADLNKGYQEFKVSGENATPVNEVIRRFGPPDETSTYAQQPGMNCLTYTSSDSEHCTYIFCEKGERLVSMSWGGDCTPQ